MKSTSPAAPLPQWTKFVAADVKGRDPLGLARMASNITEVLTPGIVVATDRARYYALYSWVLWSIQNVEAPTADSAFVEAFQRRESAIVMATLLRDPDSSPRGKEAAQKELDRDAEDLRTQFRVLPSVELGGYGQYYGGSINKLGLDHRPEGQFDQVTEGRGLRLAEAVQKTIAETPWAHERAFQKRNVPRATLLKSSRRLSLDAIRDDYAAHERAALVEILFGLDSEERDLPSLRRQSLARLLNLLRQYEARSLAVGTTSSVTMEAQLVLGPAYFASLLSPDGKPVAPYVTPEFLNGCEGMWRQFCLHELLTWSLESILSALLQVIGGAAGGKLPLVDVIRALTGPKMSGAIQRLTAFPAPSPRALLTGLGIREVPTSKECAQARLRFNLRSKINELAILRATPGDPAGAVGHAALCLALLYAKWGDGSDDPAWMMVRRTSSTDLTATRVLPMLNTWLEGNETWSSVVRTLIDLVITHHDRVMYEKGRLDACWLHHDTEGVAYDRDYPTDFPAHASRQTAAMGLLADLGLSRETRSGGYVATKAGDAIFAQVAKLGR